MLCVKDVLRWVDDRAPFRFAMSWDRCGLQVGDPEAPVHGIMVALDPSADTIEESVEAACQCLVTHHPLIFRSMNAVRRDQFPGSLVVRAIEGGINIISAHTNLDAARAGTNDCLAELLALENIEPLEVEAAWQGQEQYAGMGRTGLLPGVVKIEDLAARVADVLGGIKVRVVGDRGREVRRLALCTGSGGSLIETVITRGSDVYVTGDLKYHEAQMALAAGLSLIDVGHFASERLVVRPLAEYLQSRGVKEGFSPKVLIAAGERDPFWVC